MLGGCTVAWVHGTWFLIVSSDYKLFRSTAETAASQSNHDPCSGGILWHTLVIRLYGYILKLGCISVVLCQRACEIGIFKEYTATYVFL